MKKNHFLALGSAIFLGIACTACNTSPSPVDLKTNADTLSYAYGVQLGGESGLQQYLLQMGILQDTAMYKVSFEQKINDETDDSKKQTLKKELTTKLDSINKSNKQKLSLFIKGLTESYKTENQEAYYAGLQIGNQVRQMSDGFEKQILDTNKEKLNKSLMLAAMTSSLKGETPVLPNTSEILENKMEGMRKKAEEQEEEEAKKTHGAEIEAAAKFMEENKSKPGVVALPSGLQYKIVKEGKGEVPTANDQVEVYYKGSLTDGTVFETNQGSETIKFPVNQVIPGWTEALQLMPVGSKWILYIPYNLAYGARESGPIPAFSNLIFEIELVSVNK